MKECFEKLCDLHDELVPVRGPAESVAGELVRAANRIGYRWFNDGDQLGIGYGNETCNYAARYIMENFGGEVVDTLNALWGVEMDDLYEKGLEVFAEAVCDFVEKNPDLKEKKNTDDILNYVKPEDQEWEDEAEEEWEEEEEEEEEEESSVWTGEVWAEYDPF